MEKRFVEQYQDKISRLFPEHNINNTTKKRILTRTVTFQVTDSCNLACTYCYQINKGKRVMTFDIAKQLIDSLLTGDKGFKEYIDPSFSPGIILEFIGGEPFLQIELIDKICDYFIKRCIELRHPWLLKYRISICSNGILYFDSKVQNFLEKHKDNISFSITIDGNKKLHDSCRVFPDGSPSYDIAIKAAKDWMNRGYYMGSKITISPNNIYYLSDALLHMIELGYYDINANCVYEKGWEISHAKELYHQLKSVADYLINHLEKNINISIFNENIFTPMKTDDLQNWCGGNAEMLACDPDGNLYPCIRYMESSLGAECDPLIIGNVYNGIASTSCHKKCIECLNNIDRRTQSTDECFYCPIANGCSWCSAYNYQVYGTANKRATFICIMHKARALANAYYWSKIYEKEHNNKVYNLYLPDSESLQIVSKEELDFIKSSPNLKYIDLYKDYFLENK